MQSFDELLLLKRGGRTIYFGPTGERSAELVSYFESVPGVPRITDGANPATWMLEVSHPADSSTKLFLHHFGLGFGGLGFTEQGLGFR